MAKLMKNMEIGKNVETQWKKKKKKKLFKDNQLFHLIIS